MSCFGLRDNSSQKPQFEASPLVWMTAHRCSAPGAKVVRQLTLCKYLLRVNGGTFTKSCMVWDRGTGPVPARLCSTWLLTPVPASKCCNNCREANTCKQTHAQCIQRAALTLQLSVFTLCQSLVLTFSSYSMQIWRRFLLFKCLHWEHAQRLRINCQWKMEKLFL